MPTCLRASMIYVSTCLRSYVPKECQLLIFTFDNVPQVNQCFNVACQFFKRNAKENFCILSLCKKFYIILDIIVIHIICICIVHKNCIILHFYTSCRIKEKCVNIMIFLNCDLLELEIRDSFKKPYIDFMFSRTVVPKVVFFVINLYMLYTFPTEFVVCLMYAFLNRAFIRSI